MVHFVGAGPGAPDLITLRGRRLIEQADVIIYAGSLVNPALLDFAGKGCRVFDSSRMSLEEVIDIIIRADRAGSVIVRLHTGDPCIYSSIREQMDILSREGIEYDVTPGVSSFCGAASALNLEYTLPGITQSVIITRMEGRTPVPPKESVEALSAHGATLVLFLSANNTKALSGRLISAGMPEDTPCAIVYRATWEDEISHICTLSTLHDAACRYNITRTAIIIVGEAVLQSGYDRSKLYDPSFTTGYRKGTDL